jgi:hypothetical protein
MTVQDLKIGQTVYHGKKDEELTPKEVAHITSSGGETFEGYYITLVDFRTLLPIRLFVKNGREEIANLYSSDKIPEV